MHRIILFVEDYGHEEFITSLIERLTHEQGIPIKIIRRSVRGGHGKVLTEFKRFLSHLKNEREELPDLLIIATDANCKGYAERKKEIDKIAVEYKNLTLYAIPEPHIERWLLLDSAAFKSATGKGCKAPDKKCSRDRYKKFLLEAMQNAGIVPPLGGMEYAKDIVDAMDIQKMERANTSFGKFLKELKHIFKEWGNE
jgi:hypothetical protein